MKELLKKYNNKYFLKIGNKQVSPVLRVTTAEALNYCGSEVRKQMNSPFLFCFPLKGNSSLWLSMQLLINFYYDDYISSGNINSHEFKKGEYVKIFNCIALLKDCKEENKVNLLFADGALCSINKYVIRYFKKTTNTKLSKYSKYGVASKNFISERNIISKLIMPNDVEIINEEVLKSKVILVAGRGNKSKFINQLNETIISEEPLSHAFKEENLIITPTLENYKNIFNSDYKQKYNDFMSLLDSIIEIDTFNDVKQKLLSLRELLTETNGITAAFEEIFLLVLDDYGNEIQELKLLEQAYPGVREQLPLDLKTIIINDITQVDQYPSTIQGFIDNGIPVVIISDRNIRNMNEPDIYKSLFENNPDYYRLNWSIKKIEGLLSEKKSSNEYLDNILWQNCCKFAEQKISIKIFPENKLDKLFPIIQKEILNIEGHERLKKAFYNYLYPAYYLIKNSSITDENAEENIEEFDRVFQEIKKYISTPDFNVKIEEILKRFRSYKVNSKQYKPENNTYSNFIIKNEEKQVYIPNNFSEVNLPNADIKDIVFTGYPFHEYSGKYLFDSAFTYIIPRIEILCWPTEASMTKGYLFRRYKFGYFFDKLPDSSMISEKYLINSFEDINKEIESIFIDEKIKSDGLTEETEEELFKLDFFRYKEFAKHEHTESNYKIKCDILNFSDNAFMFLPRGSKVLSEIENNEGKSSIKNAIFSELTIGSRVFVYKKDRAAYRDISKHDPQISDAFEFLGRWKGLLAILLKNHDYDSLKLEKALLEKKEELNLNEGNPSRNNINRWLFDDEIIMPDRHNMKILLHASGLKEPDKALDIFCEKYREALSYTISLSSHIKKHIYRKLKALDTSDLVNFTVEINGTSIVVESRTIVELTRSNEEIEYNYTRKILW